MTEKAKPKISLSCIFSICLLLCLLSPFIYVQSAAWYDRLKVERHQRAWNKKAPDDFRLTIKEIGVNLGFAAQFEVCNGETVKITGSPCGEAQLFEACDSDPVDALFHAAMDTKGIFCGSSYDSQYDFPASVGCHFIEGTRIEVTEFQEITCP